MTDTLLSVLIVENGGSWWQSGATTISFQGYLACVPEDMTAWNPHQRKYLQMSYTHNIHTPPPLSVCVCVSLTDEETVYVPSHISPSL